MFPGKTVLSPYGNEFAESHCGKIKKVYSIWIRMTPPAGRENTITRYSIQEENLVGEVQEGVENYNLISLVMSCLGQVKESGEQMC